MASPLSVLSPFSSSKQNARPPLEAVSQNVRAAAVNSPGSAKMGFKIFDENTSPAHYNQCSPSPHAFKMEYDDCGDSGPPSSPFQEMVEPTATIHSLTPQLNDSEPAENNFDGNNDVHMDEADFGTETHQPPMVEEAPMADTIGLNTENPKDNDHSETENSVIHHHIPQNQTRKVSSMTVSNENMSIVFHDDDDKATPFENEVGNSPHLGYDIGDDTCLSTFSAVPNADMTLFAKLRGESPLKRTRDSTLSPKKPNSPGRFRDSILETPASGRRDYRRHGWGDQHGDYGSPTPGRKYPRIEETPNLLEFTDQIGDFQTRQYPQDSHASPMRRNIRGSPLKAMERFRSPSKTTLLDFEIPPIPTPRSLPTITPRELESLKSSFLSEISSLKATLSGRDAEVSSLKEAVADAERRVGEAMEEVRNESMRREAMESEQREWERRGKEMETVLRGVKAEIVDGERERKRLADKIEETEKSKETLEGKIVELESQLSAARQTAPQQTTAAIPSAQFKTAEDVAKEVQDAVEKVARELHSLYKGKHETKVAALKKSYEARWEKRVREAEKKFKEALEENQRLKNERDEAVANTASGIPAGETTLLREQETLEADKRVLEAKVKGLEQEMFSIKQDNDILSEQLKNERAEKGELVAVVDEWLSIQQQQQQQHSSPQQQQREDTPPPPPPHGDPELSLPRTETRSEESKQIPLPKTEIIEKPSLVQPNYENIPPSNIARFSNAPSVARPRPAAGPTPKVPRFGMPGNHVRGNSRDEKGLSGIPSKTPVAQRSGIMSSIEKMGRGGL